MKNHHFKIVEWSDEDECFIGSCPDLFYGGCHGDDEKQVFDELCQLVEDTITFYQSEAKPTHQAKQYRFFERELNYAREMSEDRWSAKIVRIGNQAVKEAQAKNRELGILNWYSVNGVLQESELNQQNREK